MQFMRKNRLTLLFLILFSVLFFAACGGDRDVMTITDQTKSEEETFTMLSYEQITPQEAKHFMETEENYMIVDARTQEEFAEGHIEGAILIPEYEIATSAPEKLPDRDALILVYCRSGRRSKIASEELVKLGYTNVKEFGGIINWPYEVVK